MKLGDFVVVNPKVGLKRGALLPCVMMEDVLPGRRLVKAEREKEFKGGAVFDDGDTLFARITPCLENGKIAQYRGSPAFGSTEFIVFRGRAGVSDSDYVYYLSLTDTIRKPAEKSMFGASGRQRADLSAILDIDIIPPSLEQQKVIASTLSAYDDLIENNTRRIQILEEMAQAIYREWFVHFRYPGHEGARMVPSEMGEIPEGWDYHSIGNVLAHHINGGWGEDGPSKDFSEPAYVIRGTDIPRARVGDISECPLRFHKPSNLKTRKLQNLDIVLEVSGGSKGQPVGRPLLIYDQLLNQFDADAICASFCKLMRPEQNIIHSEILYLHIREIYSDGRIDKYQTQSTGIINFKSQYFLDNELMIVPTRELQKQFILKVRPMFELIQTLGHKNANLRQQRDLLLPRLVSGEIEVC